MKRYINQTCDRCGAVVCFCSTCHGSENPMRVIVVDPADDESDVVCIACAEDLGLLPS